MNIDFERFDAVDGNKAKLRWRRNVSDEMRLNNNSAALLETTIKIIRDAKKRKYGSILILEDDVTFQDSADAELAKIEFPTFEWQFFYFGAYHVIPPIRYTGSVFKLVFSFCTHAYAVNSRVFDEYLAILRLRDKPIDWVLATHFQPQGSSFGTGSSIATQYANFSDIFKVNVDYHDHFRSGAGDTQ